MNDLWVENNPKLGLYDAALKFAAEHWENPRTVTAVKPSGHMRATFTLVDGVASYLLEWRAHGWVVSRQS